MVLVLITYADKGNSSKENVLKVYLFLTAAERSVFCANCYLFLIFLVFNLCSSELVFQCISFFTIFQLCEQ